MPKRIILAIIIVISFRVFADEMQKEHVQQIYPIAETDTIILIESGGSFEQHVVFCDNVDPVQRYLRVVGGVKMPDRFAERGESLFRKAEYLIIDHLDSVQVFKDKYSLYFDGYNDQFERYAYMRVSTPVLQAGKLAIETSIQTKNFQTTKNGHFGMELQLYFLKEGRHPHEVYDAPDSVINFPFPVGDSKFKTIRKNIVLPQNIATILLRVGGTNYSGECWVEAPKLIRNKKQIVSIPFIQNEKGRDNDNYWVGVNLSSRSYPHWKLEFNDSVLFDDIVFDRASNIADFYLKMPQVSGQGKLKLTLLQNNNKASFPYMLHRLQLIEESKRDFEIVFVPKYISCGDTVGVLVEINKPNTSFDVSSSGSIKLMQKEYTFEKTGLHVINAIAISPDVNVPLVFSAGKESRTVHFKQIIIKEKDDVRLSSGDEIYIDKKQDQYDYFFKWYFKSRVGNFYQFRPSYQWSGFRIVDEKIIGHYTNLLNQLHVPYAWQVEGRTLAGSRINPSLKFLQTPLFRGKQAHENDGAYYYWQHFKYEGLYSDIAARTRPYGGIFAKHRPIYTENGVFIHYDPYAVKDMADGANYFVSNLSYSRGESTRHTGPSTMFRYLYQAGYDWLGAEQMYGPENNIMSALRGASRAYYKKSFGSLHAVQWGSFPFTDPKHSKRFFMSLAVAY
ncbi:MAG: hypothetical protein Q7J05_04415, partial [Paludibacter sp.]|nr:hypothetical protein [Paludibacter sp.]